MLEHQKMVTEKGPICYACFNAIQEEAHQAEQARRAAEQMGMKPPEPSLRISSVIRRRRPEALR